MALGFLYLVAIIDWATGSSGVAPVEHDGYGLLHHGARRSTGAARQTEYSNRSGRAVHQRRLTGMLEAAGIAISMDGRGRFMDNIFIERLWRSIKYEEVHLKAYADGREARDGHWIMDELLQPSPPASGDEQPVFHGGMACRQG